MSYTPAPDVFSGDEITAERIQTMIDNQADHESRIETLETKRVGVIPGATLSTTGNKTISGLGFKPTLVQFTIGYPGGSSYGGVGATDGVNQWASAWGVRMSGTGGTQSYFRTDRCWVSLTIDASGNSSIDQSGSIVSFNEDGFTINVVKGMDKDLAYIAYG